MDLTVSDPYYALPIMTTALLYATIEVSPVSVCKWLLVLAWLLKLRVLRLTVECNMIVFLAHHSYATSVMFVSLSICNIGDLW